MLGLTFSKPTNQASRSPPGHNSRRRGGSGSTSRLLNLEKTAAGSIIQSHRRRVRNPVRLTRSVMLLLQRLSCYIITKPAKRATLLWLRAVTDIKMGYS